ncbi:hypothetical protein [Phenylobacterium sp. SCN 70-31]|uniref:hypothetical protein n=1 Tax=Phenylobacterium sp. SCN 70-31 TaxID=1660129 RepID=UPI00086E893C|nr:hypothetical protein [Phenylobacterium sp. SCN 70-31]ODT85700.1 MAG: hypothetical protein ABS78_19215 [Phenylobacterium sp. SCN 70-31]
MAYQDPLTAGDAPARPDDDLELVDVAPDTFELELDGEVHTLPAGFRGAFLRQADYTRKTQELADGRRALETEREAFLREMARGRSESRDRRQLAALDDQLAAFEAVDWETYVAEDAQGAQVLWARFEALSAARDDLAEAVARTEERETLEAAREAAEAMAETGARLREEIDGWSPEVAAKLVEYGAAFGVTLEELARMADPRLWKLLHKAWRADESARGEAGAQARSLQPAVMLSGGAGGGAGVRDELATREWMRRRNAQAAKGG